MVKKVSIINTLHHAIKSGDAMKVSNIIQKNARIITDIINVRNSSNEIPLLLAVSNGNTAIVKDLLNIKGIDIHVTDSFGHNALSIALRKGSLEIAALLRGAGIRHSKNNYCLSRNLIRVPSVNTHPTKEPSNDSKMADSNETKKFTIK